MAPEEATGDGALPPDEAFAVLGDETRMTILQRLAEAEEPLPFSELHDRVDVRDSGQFNYHLDRLQDHFVRKSDAGYRLSQAGRRVIQAILSGAVTDAPRIEPTEIDQACPYCGTRMFVGVREERVELFCPGCDGAYQRDSSAQDLPEETDYGYLGGWLLPPAGVQDRTPAEIIQAAITWGNLQFAATASGVCPRCSSRFEQSVTACETHDADEGLCDACGRRYATLVLGECTNCNFEYVGSILLGVVNEREFLAFLLDHDVNPVSPSPEAYLAIDTLHDEAIHSIDPFEGQFTFTVGEEALALTLDGELTVVESKRGEIK